MIGALALALALLGLLALTAFFAAAQTALGGVSAARLHTPEPGNARRAALVLRLLENEQRSEAALSTGRLIASTAAVVLATAAAIGLMEDIGSLIALLFMSAVLLLFGEALPRVLAARRPDRTVLALAGGMDFAVGVLGPLADAARHLVDPLLSRRHGEPLAPAQQGGGAEAVAEARRQEAAVKDDREMLDGLLGLRELDVSDVMIHRTKMESLDADMPPADLVHAVLASPHTRLPLWRGEPENIVGVLHAKDLLRALEAAGGDPARLDPATIARPPWFVPDITTLADQLRAFRRRKSHFALVVDEYGQVMGLVTLEDILEEIVGDIADEHDIAVQGVRRQPDGSVNVDGGVPIRDLNRLMGWRLPDDDATTVAGLVIHIAQAIPEPGQAFALQGFRFEVLRRQRNRITAVKVKPVATEEAPAAEAESGGRAAPTRLPG